MRWTVVALMVVGVNVAIPQVIQKSQSAGSLWNSSAKSLFLDHTACKEGDVVTILISESSVASFAAQTGTSKTDSNTISKALGPILQNLIPNWFTGANSSNSGQGSTNQTGKLAARMSAVVKKVFPNGTMLIEGTRNVIVNKETQTFRLSGIVRREDVRSDNTVRSESLAEAEIRMDGKGAISDRQRRGFLTRLLDWLF